MCRTLLSAGWYWFPFFFGGSPVSVNNERSLIKGEKTSCKKERAGVHARWILNIINWYCARISGFLLSQHRHCNQRRLLLLLLSLLFDLQQAFMLKFQSVHHRQVLPDLHLRVRHSVGLIVEMQSSQLR